MTGPNSERGTWVHPKIAIHIMFWLGSSFANCITDWIIELLVTGSVILGNELDSNDILKRIFKTHESVFPTKKNKSTKKSDLDDERHRISKEYFSLFKKRFHVKLSVGDFFYVVTDRKWGYLTFKTGYTENINNRLCQYRTICPGMFIKYVIYMDEKEMLEKYIRIVFAESYVYSNHEIIQHVELDKIIKECQTFCNMRNIPYFEGDDALLEEYNKDVEQYGNASNISEIE